MGIKYTTETLTDGNILIFREGKEIAVYSQETSEIEYKAKSYNRYKKAVEDLIASTLAAQNHCDSCGDKDVEILKLNDHIIQLKKEISRLKAEVSTLMIGDTEDGKEDLTGAPAQSPQLGDMTPEFVEWYRKNKSPEQFDKRYRRRIK